MDVHLEGACITSNLYGKLFGITIDSDLMFDKRISDHSHQNLKDSLETKAVLIEISMLC